MLPTVVSAEYEGGYRLRLAFSDHTTKTVDFRKWLDGPVFEPLKDPVYFRRLFLDGGTVRPRLGTTGSQLCCVRFPRDEPKVRRR
ncbi:MAG TPA: DUF2442 domain-containing protein [Vicinamibacteria bacterium]